MQRLGISKLHAKLTCILANIMKKFWLNFVFMRNFVHEKFIYFKWMRNFLQNWFRIDTKIMQNFVQKKSFRAKPRNCCARELTVSWKPYKVSNIICFYAVNTIFPILCRLIYVSSGFNISSLLNCNNYVKILLFIYQVLIFLQF